MKAHSLIQTGKQKISAKDAESLQKGLIQLVLQIVNLLRQLMERQALRKMPYLSIEKQEEIGLHLMLLREQIEVIRKHFRVDADEMEAGLLNGLDDLSQKLLGSVAG